MAGSGPVADEQIFPGTVGADTPDRNRGGDPESKNQAERRRRSLPGFRSVGRDAGPWEIQGSPDPLAMKKISRKDFDLLDAGGREIDLTFYSDGQDGLLRLTGRIEALEIGRTPLQFPLVNLHQPMTVRSQFLSYPLRSPEQPPSSTNVFDWLSICGTVSSGLLPHRVGPSRGRYLFLGAP